MEKALKDHITPNLLKLARLFKKKGCELYIVGGYVRNALLHVYETDIDLAGKLTINEVKEILADTKYEFKDCVKKLGTMKIYLGEEVWEYTTFRKEIYAEGGAHTPISVEFVDSIEEDAKRRDFTCNAIYYNILKNELVDFYNGVEHIRKKLIKAIETPDYVFESDGLRILRMIRIASELGFRIEGNTMLSAFAMRENLNDISGQRKREELSLILNSSTRYEISKPNSFMFGLQVFNLLRLWKYFNASVLKVRFSLTPKSNLTVRPYALLADVVSTSKYKFDKEEQIRDVLGKQGLCLSDAKIFNYIHVVMGYFDALAQMDNKSFFMEYFDDFKLISELLLIKSKRLFKKYNFYYNYLKNNKIAIRIKDLKINGNDIKANFPKIKEKLYKDILTDLLHKVFDGKIKNEKKSLIQEIALTNN